MGTVTCLWDPETCQWGVQRDYQTDAWDALYKHLAKAHGHDVHVEKPREEERLTWLASG